MDDVQHISSTLDKIHKQGLWRFSWAYGLGDLSWGMFRPTYPLLIYGVYTPGVLFGPMWTFLWNAVLSLLALWLAIYALAEKKVLWISLVAGFAFWQCHDLFLHPSLQEKLLLLFGAGLLLLAKKSERQPFWLFTTLSVLLFGVGAGTKASFAIFGAAALVQLWFSLPSNLRWARVSLWVFLLLGFVLFQAKISSGGSYTGKYQLALVIPNLAKKAVWPILLTIGVGSLFLLLRRWRLSQGIPLVGLLAFVVVFAPWDLRGYILSLATPFVAVAWGQIVSSFSVKIEKFLVLGLACIALTVTTYRSSINFSRLNDLEVWVSKKDEFLRQGISQVWMPCQEGALSMQYFLRDSALKITEPVQKVRDQDVYFYDRSLCPLAYSFIENCSVEILWQGFFSSSFKMAKMHCKDRSRI